MGIIERGTVIDTLENGDSGEVKTCGIGGAHGRGNGSGVGLYKINLGSL